MTTRLGYESENEESKTEPISREQLARLSQAELVELGLLLFQAKIKATEHRKVAEQEAARHRKEKDDMRQKHD